MIQMPSQQSFRKNYLSNPELEVRKLKPKLMYDTAIPNACIKFGANRNKIKDTYTTFLLVTMTLRPENWYVNLEDMAFSSTCKKFGENMIKNKDASMMTWFS